MSPDTEKTPITEGEKPTYVAGAVKTPEGVVDYSRAATMETMRGPKRTFFGSEKGAQVEAIARKMQEEDPIAGDMLSSIIQLAVFHPEMERKEVEQKILSKFNFDGVTGEPIDPKIKEAAISKAMQHFDDLQEIRNTVLSKKIAA